MKKGLLMAKTADEAFKIFLSWITPSLSDREKAASHRASIESKLNDYFGIYRMFQSGSFTHGTGVKGLSDVDYFVSLEIDKPTYSATILSSVRDVLKERFPSTYIHVSRPAVVLEFGSGYEKVEIIPSFPKDTVGEIVKFDIPGILSEWMESTPEAHVKYVNECNKIPKPGDAKRFIRLVKAWKYHRDVPISSFYLEMRAASYVSEQKSIIYAYDLYFFFSNLYSLSLAAMNDPTGNTGRITACSSEATRADSISKLASAVIRAEKALDAYKKGDLKIAFYYWDLLFAGAFPSFTG